MKSVDIHNHVFPQEVIEMVVAEPGVYGTDVTVVDGARRLVRGHEWPLDAEFYDADAKLESLDRRGLDIGVISSTPQAFFYWLEPALGAKAAATVNRGIANMVAKHPDRLRGIMSLPMQHPDAAVAEMERCVREYGMKGIELGTTVEHMMLADAKFRPVLRRANELKLFVFSHPYLIDHKGSLDKYYLTNLVGNPLMTLTMIANLMFSGAFDECPDLKFVLAHGGGHLPYQLGRLVHGYKVRTEPKSEGARQPDKYMKQIYFDALLHSPASVRFLIDLVGEGHVMLGTDAPFDMGDEKPVKNLDRVAGLTPKERDAICGGNVFKLLGEPIPREPKAAVRRPVAKKAAAKKAPAASKPVKKAKAARRR